MTNLYAIVGYCAASAMLVLMLMALAYSIVMPSPDRWSKNYFITFFSLLTLCVSARKRDLCLRDFVRKSEIC